MEINAWKAEQVQLFSETLAGCPVHTSVFIGKNNLATFL